MLFETIIESLKNGEEVSQYEITPFLCAEQLADRVYFNFQLAGACFAAPGNVHLAKAKHFASRAMTLSGFSEEILPLFEKIMEQCKESNELREVYKRIGLRKLNEGNFDAAVVLLNKWLYTYSRVETVDKFYYDFDILEQFEKFAVPYRLQPPGLTVVTVNRKTRLVYLMKGVCELNSVLMKLAFYFARFHDKEKYDVLFVVPENSNEILSSPQGRKHFEDWSSQGFQIMFAGNEGSLFERLINLGKRIHEFDADIMISFCALGFFNYFFLNLLRPAKKLLSFVVGPLPLFAPYHFDWSIAGYKQYFIETPSNCSLVPLEVELPVPGERKGIRGKMEISVDAVIVCIAGRPEKLNNPEFLEALNKLLLQNPELFLLILGAGVKLGEFFNSLDAGIQSKVRMVGWSAEYLDYLHETDILLDTYPTGGGVILFDALALGIPVISFSHNYMKVYDQGESSIDDNLFSLRELVIDRNSFDSLYEIVRRLVANPEYRKEMGSNQREMMLRINGNPERMIRRCEDVYADMLNRWNKPVLQNDLSISPIEDRNFVNRLLLQVEEFLKLNKPGEAQTLLMEILQRDAYNTDAMNNLAVIEIMQGNKENAKGLLQYILEIDKNNEVALNNLNLLQE